MIVWPEILCHHCLKSLTRISPRIVCLIWLPYGAVGMSKMKKFRETYGDIASLISIPIEEPVLRAALRFWDPSYRCFTFGKEDLIPTIEEYSVLMGIDLQYPNKVYNKKPIAGC